MEHGLKQVDTRYERARDIAFYFDTTHSTGLCYMLCCWARICKDGKNSIHLLTFNTMLPFFALTLPLSDSYWLQTHSVPLVRFFHGRCVWTFPRHYVSHAVTFSHMDFDKHKGRSKYSLEHWIPTLIPIGTRYIPAKWCLILLQLNTLSNKTQTSGENISVI